MAFEVVPFTEAGFIDKPASTDKLGNSWAEIAKTRKAFAERFGSEHAMADGDGADQGRHFVGSARLFVGDTAELAPEAPVVTASDAYKLGRVQYHPTAKTVSVHDGSIWQPIGYVTKSDVDESIDGIKTFVQTPLSTVVTPPSGDTELVNKKQVADLIAAALVTALAAAQNAIMPIGFVYTQYPLLGNKTPAQMSWAGTWTDITSSYGGRFFRAYLSGTTAEMDTAQAAVLLAHEHSHVHNVYVYTEEGTSVPDGGIRYVEASDQGLISGYCGGTDASGGAVSSPTPSATENRPANYAIKLWKRTV